VFAPAVSTCPNTATADPTPHDRTDHQPVLLRRAIKFIDARGRFRDIGKIRHSCETNTIFTARSRCWTG
jgi:hypothetical protein